MDIKQWAGLVVMGVGAIALSFFLNQPVDLSRVKDARPPTDDIAAISTGAASVTPVAKAPPVAVKTVPAKKAESKTAAAPAKSGESSAVVTGPAVKAVPNKPGEKGPSIKGTCAWVGAEPKNPAIDPSSDPVCKQIHEGKDFRAQRVVVNANKTLKNVVVYVDDAKVPGTAKTADVIIDQKNCTYDPHVVAVQLGQKVKVKNSDSTTHNVHFKSKINGDWNLTQSAIGTEPAKEDFKKKELGTSLFKCDIHTWMEARVCIFDHPFFAVTGDDGSFTIDGLPAGEYTLKTWHEKEKEQTIKVTVADGATVPADFTFGKK